MKQISSLTNLPFAKRSKFFCYIVFSLLFSQISLNAYAFPSARQTIGAASAIYLSSIAACDLAEYVLGFGVWDQTKRTAECYNWFEQYLKEGYDKDGRRDYSEGIFNGTYELSLEEATQKKYEYIFKELGLKEGMTLLDAGCGTGVWMEYCKARGVNVIGLTLSEEQAKVVRKKGLDVRVMDYRTINLDFIGKFNRITVLGSSEHVCSSTGALNGKMASERCNETRVNTWRNFYEYLKPSGKVYVTVLTINKESTWSPTDWLQAYILERHYGGYYSSMDDIQNEVVPRTGFRMTDLQDKTKDYHWSSVVDSDHFGYWTINWGESTLNKITYLVKGMVTDPYLLHHWLYYYMNTWMWQFGGYQKEPLTDEQVKNAPAQLKYFMLEKTSEAQATN